VGRLVSNARGQLTQISRTRIERRPLSEQQRRRTAAWIFASAAKIQIEMVHAQYGAGVELNLLVVLRASGHEEMVLVNRAFIVRTVKSSLPGSGALGAKLFFQDAFVSRFPPQAEKRIARHTPLDE